MSTVTWDPIVMEI